MRARVHLLKEFLVDRSGAMTVEFVATVPLLLAAMVFSFEFGKALWAYDVVTRDVRGAVRYVSRAPSSLASTNQAQCLAMTGLPVGTPPTCNNNPKHFPWTDAANFPAVAPVPFSNANFSQDGSVITMTANVPVTLSLLSFFCNMSINMFCINTNYTLAVSDQTRWIGN